MAQIVCSNFYHLSQEQANIKDLEQLVAYIPSFATYTVPTIQECLKPSAPPAHPNSTSNTGSFLLSWLDGLSSEQTDLIMYSLVQMKWHGLLHHKLLYKRSHNKHNLPRIMKLSVFLLAYSIKLEE